MRKLQQFYSKVNCGFEYFFKFQLINKENWKEVEPLIPQTPGRHIYYKTDMEFTLPENIRWEVRMPEKYAVPEESKKYSS